MKISTESYWYHWMLNSTLAPVNSKWEMPNTLCQVVWKTMTGLFWQILAYTVIIWTTVSIVLAPFLNYMQFWGAGLGGSILEGMAATGMAIFISVPCLYIATLVVWYGGKLNDYVRQREINEDSSFIKDVLWGIKNKVCPLVEYE